MDLVAIMTTLAGVSAGLMMTAPAPIKKQFQDTTRTVSVYRSLMRETLKEGRQAYKLGITPAVMVHGSTLSFRVISYNYAYHHNMITTAEGETILYKAIAFCGFTGLVSDVVSNPYNLIRAKMHLANEAPADSLCQLIKPDTSGRMMKHLIRAHGYGVMFMGLAACIPRGFISSSMHVLTYCLIKNIMREKSIMDHSEVELCTVASVIGAAVSCCCVAPFDLILTRLHYQPLYVSGRGILYNGVRDCIRKTYLNEGIEVFYRGVGMLCLKKRNMYGEKAVELVKEVNRNRNTMTPYNTDLIEQISKEILMLTAENRIDVEENMETTGGNVYISPVKIRHIIIQRNLRCLLSYHYNRLRCLRTMRWEFGSIIPTELKANLSRSEQDWFSHYSSSLVRYMRTIGEEGGVNLNADMKPPKSLYIEVRCLVDYGKHQLSDGSVILLKKNTRYYLPRVECEEFIRLQVFEHIVS